MENSSLIKEFTDKIIKNDDTSGDSIRDVIVNKTKSLVANWKKQAAFDAVCEGVLDDSPVKFNGNDVLINNKVIGHIKYDLNDEQGGINFISEDGKFSKEFDDVETLFRYLIQKFNVKENKMEDLGTSIETPKKVDFEGKENLVKQDGTENSDVDGKKNADKKSETKGEFHADDATSVGATSKYGKLKTLIGDIKAGKRKTSTSATVTENKKNWNFVNSDADGDGKVGALKTKVKKIKDIADKQGPEKTEKAGK
jgi:hypothetical protein